MTDENALPRHRLIVPGVALALIVVVVGALWLLGRGDGDGDDAAPAAPTTPASSPAQPAATTAKLAGSGDAPAAISLGDVTVARSDRGFGLAADIPKIDLEQFDTVTLTLRQGSVDWRLVVARDARGAFLSPALQRVQDGDAEQVACQGATMRVKATRLNMAMPLTCLDEPGAPLRARLRIEDGAGKREQTTWSSALAPPAA